MSRATQGQEDVGTRSVMSSVIRCRHMGRRRVLYVMEDTAQGPEDVVLVALCLV